MSHYEFDNNPDGDWEDKGDLVWNEFDWEKHLREHDKEVAKFRQFYDVDPGAPQHLDEVASQMGWESGDWSLSSAASYGDLPFLDVDGTYHQEDDEDDGDFDEDDFDPYTLHRHPILIAQRGMVESFLEHVAQAPSMANAPVLSAIFKGLRKMEFNSFMALEALEIVDYPLVIAHLKRALNDVNFLFIPWEKLCMSVSGLDEKLLKAGQLRLFDLRELWLRVIHESREEIQNRGHDHS